MPPRLHPTHSHITHRQNSIVLTTQLPRPGRKLNKRRHHGCPCIIRSSLHTNPTPFVTLGDEQFAAIQTLSRIISKVTENPPTDVTPKTPRLAPAGALQTDCPAPSPRVPTLTPPALTPRVTMVPENLTHDNPPPKPVPITPAQFILQPTPTPTPAIIETNREDPVLSLQYNIRPQICPSPYNR